MKKTALVIVNGLLPFMILKKCVAEADVIICADGGANYALENDIHPDYVVGDLDSIRPETRAALKDTQFIHRPSQYSTDLEKTMQYAIENGIERVLLVGMTGLRLDHQICNLHMGEKFSHQVAIEIHDDFGIGTYITAGEEEMAFEFDSYEGQVISLLAFRRVESVTTEGLKYPLTGEALEWAVRDGLSNEVIGSIFTVHIKNGTLFVYRRRDY